MNQDNRTVKLIAIDILNGVLNLFQTHGWIQHTYARTEETGRAVTVMDPAANCFCLLGAISRVASDLKLRDNVEVMREIDCALACKPVNYVIWQDRPGRTKDQVLALVRKGIEHLQAEAA